MTGLIILTVGMIVFGIFEVRKLIGNNKAKEALVFIAISLLALVLGYYYTLNPYRVSFVEFVVNLLNVDF